MPDPNDPRLDVSRYDSIAAIAAADPPITIGALARPMGKRGERAKGEFRQDRWSDDVWRLDGANPGNWPPSIGWKLDAPATLIEEFKLLAAILFIGPKHRSHYSATSAVRFTSSARHMADFMASLEGQKITSLSQLDERLFVKFQERIEKTISRPSLHVKAFRDDKEDRDQTAVGAIEDDERQRAKQERPRPRTRGRVRHGEAPGEGLTDDAYQDRDQLTCSIVENWLHMWTYMQKARPELARFGVIVPKFEPFPKGGGGIKAMSVALVNKGLEDVEPLPDEVVIPILNKAYALLGTPADDVCRLQAEFLRVRSLHSRDSARGHLRALVQGFTFSEIEK